MGRWLEGMAGSEDDAGWVADQDDGHASAAAISEQDDYLFERFAEADGDERPSSTLPSRPEGAGGAAVRSGSVELPDLGPLPAGKRGEKLRSRAVRFGLTPEAMRYLEAQLLATSSVYTGSPDAKALTARALGISAPELQALRKAMAQQASGVTDAALATANGIVGRPRPITKVTASTDVTAGRRKVPQRSTSSSSPSGPTPAQRAGLSRLGKGTATRSKKLTERDFFVADHSERVHLYSDCRGLRGFRSTGEADPRIYRVTLRHRHARDKTACKVCVPEVSQQRLIEQVISGVVGAKKKSRKAKR